VVTAEKQEKIHLQLPLFKLPFLIRLLDTWMLVYKKLPGAQGRGEKEGVKRAITRDKLFGWTHLRFSTLRHTQLWW
jgi:hypothetical protein